MLSPAHTMSPSHSTTTETHPYYRFAQEAIEAVKARFPKGPLNQVHNINQYGYTKDQLIERFETIRDLKINEVPEKRRAWKAAEITKHLESSDCEIFSYYGIGFLRSKYPLEASHGLFECVYLKAHVLLAIGRDPNSNPKNFTTWGAETLFCAPWTQDIYTMDEFILKRETRPSTDVYLPIFSTQICTANGAICIGKRVSDITQKKSFYL